MTMVRWMQSSVLTAMALATVVGFAQQPVVEHAQVTVRSAEHGLAAELEIAKHVGSPVWVGWSIPVQGGFSSGWDTDHPVMLEGESRYSDGDHKQSKRFDHSFILLRVAGGSVEKLRVEQPDRQLDAGGLQFVWLNGVAPEDSVRTLAAMAKKDSAKKLRDSLVFAVSIHETPVATEALAELASDSNELEVREKAAFWLANQRGAEGFKVIQRLAQKDEDAQFREKLTFDLTLVKDPASAALTELIRMAHQDSSPQVRKQAQFWMATKGGKQVAGDLREQAENDPNEQVRKQAVFALSQLQEPEASTQLIQVASTNKDPVVRKQAVFWLGQSHDPRALEYLTKLLQQP
ncbi:HEAT repeat protein [Granulicella aggregans]|uniref:HEAT repeat protein n=1 Tax=Granulicella aggregans TaxID=474949 RepID=A0A7W7Z9U9_9BACT|nr:HEAT repeat domain-containing protein [Granulicella aggregans]MBB5055988.1 HEAT repeat protein [Granulicella aggregans]